VDKNWWGLVSSAAGWDRPQTCGPTDGLHTLGHRPLALLLGLPPTSGTCHAPPASLVVQQDWGHLLGMHFCWGTHRTVPQTLTLGEKGLQPHESLFGHSCPFSSAWWQARAYQSSTKTTTICLCKGQSRSSCFGTSPLPHSSPNVISRGSGRDQVVDCCIKTGIKPGR